MAKNKERPDRHSRRTSVTDHDALSAVARQPDVRSEADTDSIKAVQPLSYWSSLGRGKQLGAVGVILLLVLGAFGSGLKYLEDSAKRQRAEQSAAGQLNQSPDGFSLSSLNPFTEPLPTPTPAPTPQLSKEYIYAGSRMLAVEDANASAAPPADLAVWRPSTGYWYVLGGQGSAQTQAQWGGSGDNAVPGDYDGDGKTDFSVFRRATGFWYISYSSNGYTIEIPSFGASDDAMAQADYDGDGKTDAAVFRPSTGWWYIKRSSDSGMTSIQYGLPTDKPAPADYDGDGKADIAVWRGSNLTFYINRSSNNQLQVETLSSPTTDGLPYSADYDGDGKADATVRSATTNNWHIKQSSNNSLQTVAWQQGSDKAVPNDYDGDGKVDIAVWRESIGYWLIRQSSLVGQTNELRQTGWGAPGDIPVPAFYRR